MADGTKCSNVKGKGTVSLQLSTAIRGEKQQVVLTEVYFMPSLNHAGIISVRCGMQQDMSFIFAKGCSHMKVKDVCFPFYTKHKLFYVNSVNVVPTASRSAREWHEILGHLHFPAVYKMPGKVEGMLITHQNQRHCNPCTLNKATWRVPKTPRARCKNPMSFIHCDIGQPHGINTKNSYGDFNYFINFVCDYSGFMYTIPLVHRAEALKAFQEFVNFSTEYGKITRLRTDGAREFTSHGFNDICNHHGIHHEYSVPRTSNTNGTA